MPVDEVMRKEEQKSRRVIKSFLLTALLLFAYVAGLSPMPSLERAAQAVGDKHQGRDRSDKVSAELRERVRHSRNKSSGGDERVEVIIQHEGKLSGQLNALLNRNGVHVRARFRNFDSMKVELPASVVEELEAYDEIKFVSPDSEISSLGTTSHIEHTTGTDLVRAQTQPRTYTLDGSGIGIAVLDSGIYASHQSFNDSNGRTRVIVSKDFTGEGRTDDPYGHGTHVASAAVGSSLISKGRYTGIAPNANVINLRVLNARGTGTVSGLLAALDWVMTNHAAYNIRVVNMSLGYPAIDSYKFDPACRAARRLVDAGIAVFVAAGNNGKDAGNDKLYGHIHSPGNEPSVMTLGASNTFGSDNRADDTVATFSSRGPTRSYWTDTSGAKHYDNLIKPDLVAPGNKIVCAQAKDNLLVKQNPNLNVHTPGNSERRMMRLSGTSMATPIAAGAAALLFQVNPRLTPNMIKMILMYTAQQLSGFNMFEQGAGEINIEGAVRLAKAIRTDLTSTTRTGTPLLSTSTPPLPQTSITWDDEIEVKDPLTGLVKYTYQARGTSTFNWAQGMILNQTYATGTNLITRYQGIYGAGVLVSDGVLISDGVLVSDGVLISDGITMSENILTSDGITMSEGIYFYSMGPLRGDGVLISDGVLVGDGVLVSDGVLISDGVLTSDAILAATLAMTRGDDTASMK
jgi:serine protease AprX